MTPEEKKSWLEAKARTYDKVYQMSYRKAEKEIARQQGRADAIRDASASLRSPSNAIRNAARASVSTKPSKPTKGQQKRNNKRGAK